MVPLLDIGPSGRAVEANTIANSLSRIQDLVQTATKETGPTSTRCMFLELPREMRNEIYGHVFTLQTLDEEVHLHRDKPLSKALCHANKQIYNETYALFNQAFRTFYRKSNFHIGMDDLAASTTPWRFTASQEMALNKVTRLTISFSMRPFMDPSDYYGSFNLRPDGRSWKFHRTFRGTSKGTVLVLGPSFSIGRIIDGRAILLTSIVTLDPLHNATFVDHESVRVPPLTEQLKLLSLFAAESMVFTCIEDFAV